MKTILSGLLLRIARRLLGPVASVPPKPSAIEVVEVGSPEAARHRALKAADADVAQAFSIAAQVRAGQRVLMAPCSYCETPTRLIFQDGIACCPADGCLERRWTEHRTRAARRDP